METHLLLSIVNTHLRDGKTLEDIAFELGYDVTDLNEH